MHRGNRGILIPVDLIIAKQRLLMDILSKAFANANSFDKKRHDALESFYEVFEEQHREIEENVFPEQRLQLEYYTMDLFRQFQDKYRNYKEKLRESTSRRLVPNQSTSSTSVSNMLPQMEVPRFSGGYENWLSFRSIFKSLIHDNVEMSLFEKIYYLKNHLEGAAKDELQYIPTLGCNYEDAWKRLNERYNNKRMNANEVLKRLFALSPISQDSSQDISHLLTTATGCLSSLSSLGVDVSSWDPIIIHIVESKMGRESYVKWMTEIARLGSDALPIWEQLKTFLMNRLHFLETMEMNNIAGSNN